MKKFIFTASLLFWGLAQSLAQKVDIKKNDILIDGNSTLKLEKINLAEYSITDKNDTEILHFQTKQDAETGQTYLFFYFTQIKEKVESNNVGRITGLGYKAMMKNMLTWLVKDKVIGTDGSIDAAQVAVFKDKYGDR